ncbi:hypothetical protein AAEP93_008854 [Penicillium crustosum]
MAETMVLKGEDQQSLVAFILLRSRADSQLPVVSFLIPSSDIFRIKVQAASTSFSTTLTMLPDFYVSLHQVPLTISHKTSRKYLPQLDSEKNRQSFNDFMCYRRKRLTLVTQTKRVLRGVFAGP